MSCFSRCPRGLCGVRCVGILALGVALAGCGDSGERAARHWLEQQRASLSAPSLAAAQPVVDTPPADYTSKAIDPFLPERISARDSGRTPQASDVLFPEAPLASLVVSGYLTGDGRVPVALVRYGAQYRGVRVGDRLSDRAVRVKEVGPQGVLVSMDGGPDQWLPLGKS